MEIALVSAAGMKDVNVVGRGMTKGGTWGVQPGMRTRENKDSCVHIVQLFIVIVQNKTNWGITTAVLGIHNKTKLSKPSPLISGTGNNERNEEDQSTRRNAPWLISLWAQCVSYWYIYIYIYIYIYLYIYISIYIYIECLVRSYIISSSNSAVCLWIGGTSFEREETSCSTSLKSYLPTIKCC